MKKLHLAVVALFFSVMALADNSITEADKQFFIDTYAALAIAQMGESEIPASIILSQAILESGWGRGKVAMGANNYFCIKCNNGWEGPTFEAKDDEAGLSCFRKYATVAQSFRDHSLFLKKGKRYRSLFQLDKTDYRGWATGLQKCGYATDPAYARRLIELIEVHGLWIFDLAISEQYFEIIDTPQDPPLVQQPKVESTGNRPAPAFYDPTPDATAQPAADMTDLAVPVYHFAKEQAQYSIETARPLYPEKIQRRKIRPIIPHPVVALPLAR